MEQTLKVKDFVIDIPSAIKEVKTKKTQNKSSKHTFEVVLENNTDFVLKRITSTTDKSLVFLISQGVFYIKNNKNDDVEILTEQKLRAFFQQVYYSRFEEFTKVEWWKDKTPEKMIEKMMNIVTNENMRKMYQHNIFIEDYQANNWAEAFNSNIKLFRYCYERISNCDINCSRFDYILKLSKSIFDAFDFNNAKYFIDMFAESQVKMELWSNSYKDTQFSTFINIIKNHNLNFNRFVEYVSQDLYAQGITNLNENILNDYKDYLDMQVSLYGRVKEKYPKHLKTDHDIIILKFNTYKKFKQDLMIFNVTEKNKELIYKNKTYSIILPQTSMDIVDEGVNQSHCVASYVDRVAKNETLILFMRLTDDIEKSLLTIEVQDNIIKQVKGFANRLPIPQETKFINEWAKEKKLLNKANQ